MFWFWFSKEKFKKIYVHKIIRKIKKNLFVSKFSHSQLSSSQFFLVRNCGSLTVFCPVFELFTFSSSVTDMDRCHTHIGLSDEWNVFSTDTDGHLMQRFTADSHHSLRISKLNSNRICIKYTKPIYTRPFQHLQFLSVFLCPKLSQQFKVVLGHIQIINSKPSNLLTAIFKSSSAFL